jgi:hypothetical protein
VLQTLWAIIRHLARTWNLQTMWNHVRGDDMLCDHAQYDHWARVYW